MAIKKPYLLFLGEAEDMLSIKTANALAQWCPDDCIGEITSGATVTTGLQQITIDEARAKGCKTLIIGVTTAGGKFNDAWIKIISEAIKSGMDVASGLHIRLGSIPEIKNLARENKRELFDVRHYDGSLDIGKGYNRKGKRILTVGTDCSCGKMFTSLSLTKAMQKRKINVDFVATGQTGILISGKGIPLDAVAGDFIAGSTEKISPDNEDNHFDIIEGQGSLFHPSFAGITTALIHGSQPDYLVMCHEPHRPHMRGLPHYKVPPIYKVLEACLASARLTNPNVKLLGIAIFGAKIKLPELNSMCRNFSEEFRVPVVDPAIHGSEAIVEYLENLEK